MYDRIHINLQLCLILTHGMVGAYVVIVWKGPGCFGPGQIP